MEENEFNRIAESYTDVVYRAVLSYCKNISDAEDAVQNAFCKLWKTDTCFADDEHVRRWLIKTAINECKNIWKSYWRRNVTSFDVLESEPSYEQQEDSGLFHEVMRLPPKYSAVIHLYYYEQYSCKEIAAILNISESTVQTRLMRARKQLKDKLEAWQ